MILLEVSRLLVRVLRVSELWFPEASLTSFVQGMAKLGELARHLVESSHQLGLALR
jgi:hypothetical protein